MRKGLCKHFRSPFHHKTCEAGIDYDSVTPEPERQLGKGLRLPCRSIPVVSSSPEQLEEFEKRGTCACFLEPTDEEVAVHEKSMKDHIAKMLVVEGAVAPLRQKFAKTGGSETIKCPVCGGKLAVSISSYNGHARVVCSTESCVRWME
jgi:hypothetical protein